MSAQAYLPHMMRDKKVLAGEMRLVLPLAIGKSECAAECRTMSFLARLLILSRRNNKKVRPRPRGVIISGEMQSREHKPLSGVLNG
jgi:hypothetical protein